MTAVPTEPTERSGPDTRERILTEAAILFAGKGFNATSTRDIARAVGVQQPSLFHHFQSKQEVLAELLDRDLIPALEVLRQMRTADAGAATRLYAYLRADVATLIDFPFDARGFYDDAILDGDEFTEQRGNREEFHEEIRGLVVEGIGSGEFRPIDADFARQVITAMTLLIISTVGAHHDEGLDTRPAEVADFVLLGLLADPTTLEAVRAGAETIRAD